MHAIRYQTDTALLARLAAKAKHSQPIPERVRHRYYQRRVNRIDLNRKRALWGPLHGVEL